MISYFTKMYQAVPALSQIQMALGGSFVSTRATTIRAIQANYSKAHTAKISRFFQHHSPGHQQLVQSDLIVTGSPNNSLLKPFKAKKIMVFHGTFAPLSIIEAKAMAHFDQLCVIGPRMMHIIEQAGLCDKAFVSGYLPFLEHPEKDADKQQQFLLNLGLDPSKKTVLYLPAGRPIGSWDLMAEKLVREIPAEYNLILRPHPSGSVTARFKDKLCFMRLQIAIKERGNAYLDLTSQKLSHLFARADLIISDGTSPAEEALYYDLPQLFVQTNLYSYSVAKKILLDKKIETAHAESVLKLYDCGDVLMQNANNIAQLVENALLNAPKFAQQRSDYFNYVFGSRDNIAQKTLVESLRQYA
jgi:CDP-Glycerol:Poly(glycerophosphate) glycerophosphotransferase